MTPIEYGQPVRCKFFVSCGQPDCYHFSPHDANRRPKKNLTHPLDCQKMRYCRWVKGFVYDIHMSTIDSAYQDPNLAFKASRP